MNVHVAPWLSISICSNQTFSHLSKTIPPCPSHTGRVGRERRAVEGMHIILWWGNWFRVFFWLDATPVLQLLTWPHPFCNHNGLLREQTLFHDSFAHIKCKGTLKPDFHYPSWRVTGFHYPSSSSSLSWRPVNSASGNARPSTRVVETGLKFHTQYERCLRSGSQF